MPTLTAYPDANVETTSVDGGASHELSAGSGITWANLIAAVGSASQDSSSGSQLVAWTCDTVTDRYRKLERSIFLFDTSALPDDASIVSAVFSVYGYTKVNEGSWADVKLNVYSSAPASNVALVGGDFDSLGATKLCDTDVTYTNFDATGYNDFILNATGLALISKIGITKLGLREVTYDVGGSTPTWGSGDRLILNGYFADKSGSQYHPKLVITYDRTWVVSTSYAEDDEIEPAIANGTVYTCTTAGTSGSYEPPWIFGTVTDNTVVWEARAKMAVIDENEVTINSIRYPIIGKVRPILSSNFAEKQVIGEYTKASNPNIDSWVIGDQRGGILAEEMDEARQSDRAWWSTCNLGFLGHILLPPLATTVTLPTAVLPNNDMETDTNAWVGGAQSAVQEQADSYSWAATAGVSPYMDIPWDDSYQSTEYVFTCHVWAAEADKCKITIDDGVDTTDSTIDHPGTSGWVELTATKTLAANATRLRLILNNAAGGATAYFDTADINPMPTELTRVKHFAHFNNGLYCAMGSILAKLDADGNEFVKVKEMGDVITDLIPSGNQLFIYLGDLSEYWLMGTDDATFSMTNAVNATYGLTWDSKLWKINSAGALYYCAAPATITPTWVANGNLAKEGLADGDVQSLFIYRSAAGSPIIYAGTKLGLYAHSYAALAADASWVATELAMPQHTTAGKGVVHWRDRSYTSAGLDVLAYQTGQAGTTITSVGLDRDDGLPTLRGGEIVKFIKGYNEFFALVDSTYEGATSRSTVMAYDGKGWQCWWKAGSNNLRMDSGIVSSVYDYRLWFNAGTSVYYIPLQRNLRNPKKVSTFAYHTAGIHITPWFDANWVGQKLALQLKVFCKDVTANETVLVEYRIDHIEVDLTTGWNTLGTIVAVGNEVETTYTFGSSLGTNFKAIQFRFTLGRDAGGSNPEYDSPDVQYVVLEYQKIIKPTWNWAFTVDCTKEYNGRTANQMLDAIVTAAELETLIPFVFKDTTFYTRVKSVEGERLSGDGRKGTYNIIVSKPV